MVDENYDVSSPPECAHEGCSCRLEEKNPTGEDVVWYCSEACSKGLGCGHSGCGCGD